MSKNSIPVPAVIWGDMNLLRASVGVQAPKVVLSTDPKDITFRSRYCWQKKVIANPLLEPAAAVRGLIELGETFLEKPVLFYDNDLMLLLISRNREQLSKYYRFLMPEPKMVESLVDKVRFTRLAETAQLPVARTITSLQAKTAEEALKQLRLPCVLKPNLRIGWFESQAIQDQKKPQKVLRANDPDEFFRLYNKIKQFCDDFVMQEYIPGGDNCIYSFHAYYNKHSEPLAFFVGRKIRTYPKDIGMSTCLELAKEPEVVRLGLDILKKLNFVGPVKLDFKKDATTNQFHLMEINARFTLWSYLGAVCGINLLKVAYADFVGEQCQLQNNYRTGVKWLSFGNDLRSFIRDYHKSGDLSWARWLLSYKGKKIYDVFSWSDPYPFIISMINYLKAVCRRFSWKLSKGVAK
jgi:D-aspartate ligase